jgi:hypothetical protein
MKNIILLAAIGTAALTGCSTMNDRSSAESSGVGSALSFSPVTSPEELVKWSGTFRNVRSIETYTFVAPTTVSEPIDSLPEFSESLPPGSVFVEAAGGEPQPYRVIRHSPHAR